MSSRRVIGEVMTRDPVVVRGGTPVGACAMRLAESRLRHLPVVDERGGLAGVVDDATVFQRGAWLEGEGWVPYELDGPQGVARDLAAPARLVVGPSEPLVRVLEALRDGLDCIVVVDPDHAPIGVFTDHDAVALAAAELPAEHLAVDAGTRPAVTVPRDGLALEGYDALFAFDVQHAVVVEDERPVAVLSWRDLVEHDVARRPHLRVGAVMPDMGLFTVTEAESVAAAAGRMAEHKVGCLPIVDEEGRLLRVIERCDVIALLVDHLSR